jgi:NhaP-type Na+/H+ or K+/H+ antiporter
LDSPQYIAPADVEQNDQKAGAVRPAKYFDIYWVGMKGIVSMTIALSVPAKLPNDQPFPFQFEGIYLTFFVILFSLFLRGLTIPLVGNG